MSFIITLSVFFTVYVNFQNVISLNYWYKCIQQHLIMKKNSLGYFCPIVHDCCFCIPLKKATFIIATLGIIPTVVCLVLSTPVGNVLLEEHGIPRSEAVALGYIYAALGIVVFSSHVILSVAGIIRLKKLFTIYLWSMIFFMIMNLILAFVVSIEAIYFGSSWFGVLYMIQTLIYTCILLYFWIVIQSQLFNENSESNVIHINITII